MVKGSAAHCNAVVFPPIVVAAGYFVCMSCHQFYLGVLGWTDLAQDTNQWRALVKTVMNFRVP
jgi:hypothetical protein